MKNYIIHVCLSFAILVLSCCSKNGDATPPGGSSLTGKIYYAHFDGFSMLDLPTGEKTVIRPSGTHYNWYLTADGSTLMEMTDGRAGGRPDHIKFSIKSMADGVVRNEFFYRPRNGGSNYQAADLSPDKSMICIFPSFDEGYVLLDAKTGDFLGEITAINGERVSRYESFVWLPDNSLVFKWKNFIVRGKLPFDVISVVREFDTEDFGSFSSSHDGNKLAFNYQNHIAVMHVDGSEFYLATKGDKIESNAAFSPDGSQLLVGTNFQTIPVPGSVPSSQRYMKVIPLDGRSYDPNSDAEVLPVLVAGEKSAEPTKGQMVWVR
ncbi:TolB-like translocation protein [Sphingobacterium paludis]|nr:PD40 domain-containing protein [Sphingobacterium paludis]